jgi:hypothetical protein
MFWKLRVAIALTALAVPRGASALAPCSNAPAALTSATLRSFRNNWAMRLFGAQSWQSVLTQGNPVPTERTATSSEVEQLFGSSASAAASSAIITVQTSSTITNAVANSFTKGQSAVLLSNIFLFTPTQVNSNYNDVLVIVHQGHFWNFTDSLKENFDPLIADLLAKGFSVAAIRMPMCEASSTCSGNENHGLITQSTYSAGSALRFFINPVLQFINYVKSNRPQYKHVAMLGLSGGSWTTALYSALDDRVECSFFVNGPYPFYPNLVEESAMTVLGNPCEYLTLYSMAAADPKRIAVEVQSRWDPFFGQNGSSVPNASWKATISAYGSRVQAAISGLLSHGEFQVVVYDSGTSVNQVHQVPQWAIENVIVPDLLQSWR